MTDDALPRSSSTSPLLVVKQSWRYAERLHEGDILQQCANKGVKGLVEYHYHSSDGTGPLSTIHTIIGETNLSAPAFVPRAMEASTGDGLSEMPPKKRSGLELPKSAKRRKTKPRDLGADSSPICHTAPLMKPGMQNRLLTQLVISRGLPITNASTDEALCVAFCDAVRGHYSLLTVGGIHHRDISINNIMLPVHRRSDNFRGFLIDLDLAIPVDHNGVSGAKKRIGTYELLPTEGLISEIKQNYYDDLQSFFWIFIWVASKTHKCGLVGWSRESELAGALKNMQATVDLTSEKMCEGFASAGLKLVASKMRKALWKEGKLVHRAVIVQDPVRDEIYRAVVQAFDEALPIGERLGGDWIAGG